MFSGGIGSNVCLNSSLITLYSNFESLYVQQRAITEAAHPVIKSSEGHNIELFKKSGNGWDAYSRRYKTKENKFLTVQITSDSILKIFGANGEELARVEKDVCWGELIISQKQKNEGDDVLIRSALKAVTGQNYQVVAYEKLPF